MKMITRFAPSPTGYLHLGNIRTALFNALLAYHHHGAFLLRIEDTDLNRSETRFTRAIQEDLAWLGLTRSKTTNAFLLQSKRHTTYQHYLAILKRNKAVYPCFCTEARLNKLREEQRLHHQPPGYDGRCRELSEGIANEYIERGDAYHFRFHIPSNQIISFNDLVKGEQQFNSNHLSDFVIQRSDGGIGFLYGNVLDDALTQVTHVLRGEDHLTNTAKQLLILQALNLHAPEYGHVPLISHEKSNTPLSKRDNSFSLREIRQAGYLPEAILNYLARTGHTIDMDTLLSMHELAQQFSLKKLQSSAAHFNNAQLDFWQKKAMNSQDPSMFWNRLNATLKKAVPDEKRHDFIQIIKPMVLYHTEANKWIDRLFLQGQLLYPKDLASLMQQSDLALFKQLIDVARHHSFTAAEELQQQMRTVIHEEKDKSRRKVHWKALRIALTAEIDGPDMLSVIHLLGVEKAIDRLKDAAHLFA